MLTLFASYVQFSLRSNWPFPVGADLCRYKEPTRGCESNNRVNHVSSNRRKRVDALLTGTLGDTCVRGGVCCLVYPIRPVMVWQEKSNG